MFEDATFHSRGILPNQAPKWMLLTSAVNAALVAALIVLPLLYPGTMPGQLFHRILYTPPAEAAPIVQHPLSQPANASARPIPNPFIAPSIVPTLISKDPVGPPPGPTALPSGTGDIPGALNQSASIFHTASLPTVQSAPSAMRIISSGVSNGLLLSRTNPTYPAIARIMHISGTVVLTATISTTGRIENPQVASGPPALRQAAIDAVRAWRYRPYLLNNQPVEVETSVYIVFKLE